MHALMKLLFLDCKSVRNLSMTVILWDNYSGSVKVSFAVPG